MPAKLVVQSVSMRLMWSGFLAVVLPLAAWAQAPLAGTWELVRVAATDIQDSDPRGVTNTKLHFTADGKLFALKPDEALMEKVRATDFKLEGDRLTVLRPGARPYLVKVSFPDAETMLFTPQYASQRTFRRLSGPDVVLEPKSLQVVKLPGAAPVDEPLYDGKDYSALAPVDRLGGIWEVIAYRKVPRNQAPPYGFLNDLWTFKKESVSIASRVLNATDSVPFSYADGRVTASGVALGGRPGSKADWSVTFNNWGHLVLDRPDAQIVLKLVSKDAAAAPAIPLKIVLLSLAGEQ